LTKSRRRSSESSEALEDLAAGRSRTAGGLSLKTTGGQFHGFGLKTWAEVPRRNGAARGGITKVASRGSKFVKEAGPSDRLKKSWTIMPSDQWFGSKISRGKTGIV
jgi:hypothetical protein